MKIGVFDSGVGGKSVANAIVRDMPDLEIVLRQDKQNVPYGTKTPAELLVLIRPIFDEFIKEGCRVVVVACNTVTTTLITRLRELYPIPLVAIEPMVKPAAALTKTGTIAVCATPTTLTSERYAHLKQLYTKDITVLEPDCSDWSGMIEKSRFEVAEIADRIENVIKSGADVIVLGCTHYHWIEEELKQLAKGRATVIQPEEAIIRRLKTVLAQLT